jgi:calcium-dependent protein kinase
VIQSLNHPYILKVYEIYEDAKYLHVVSEECRGRSLMDLLLANRILSEAAASHIILQVIKAVSHMH